MYRQSNVTATTVTTSVSVSGRQTNDQSEGYELGSGTNHFSCADAGAGTASRTPTVPKKAPPRPRTPFIAVTPLSVAVGPASAPGTPLFVPTSLDTDFRRRRRGFRRRSGPKSHTIGTYRAAGGSRQSQLTLVPHRRSLSVTSSVDPVAGWALRKG